jgi:hypothetical protein
MEARKHVLTVDVPPAGIAFVTGDNDRLGQVVENLLGNAAKYTPDGGQISLTLETEENWARIIVRGETNVVLVALTGYQKDVQRLNEAGFDTHLIKPPDMQQLSALIAGRGFDGA